MAEEFRVLRPREYHSQLILRNLRHDGRGLDQFRPVKLEIDAIRTADSSSLVKIGNTTLVCGCTIQKTTIDEKDSDQESLKLHVEIPPISSNHAGFKTHHIAQLLTKSIKDILDDTECLNLACLTDNESKTRHIIDVEVICLNYHGSMIDAALLSVLTALSSLKIEGITQTIVKPGCLPICTSFAILSNRIICDPNLEEEAVAQSLYTITIDGLSSRLVGIQKVGGRAISQGQLVKSIEFAKKRTVEIKPMLMR